MSADNVRPGRAVSRPLYLQLSTSGTPLTAISHTPGRSWISSTSATWKMRLRSSTMTPWVGRSRP